jgi:hypothetical protein
MWPNWAPSPSSPTPTGPGLLRVTSSLQVLRPNSWVSLMTPHSLTPQFYLQYKSRPGVIAQSLVWHCRALFQPSTERKERNSEVFTQSPYKGLDLTGLQLSLSVLRPHQPGILFSWFPHLVLPLFAFFFFFFFNSCDTGDLNSGPCAC